jgi:hypothetical protein
MLYIEPHAGPASVVQIIDGVRHRTIGATGSVIIPQLGHDAARLVGAN